MIWASGAKSTIFCRQRGSDRNGQAGNRVGSPGGRETWKLQPTGCPPIPRKKVNQRVRRQTGSNLRYYADHLDEIDDRLAELEREWDIERTLEANAASISVVAVLLGLMTAKRKWFILPGIVGAFLLQHALQGWCPPLPFFRRLGIRTQTETERERHALKALLQGLRARAVRYKMGSVAGS